MGYKQCFLVLLLVASGGVCADRSPLNRYDYAAVIEDKIHNVDWNNNFTHILHGTIH